MKKRKIALGVTGASGAIYAKLFLKVLSGTKELELSAVMTEAAKQVWALENGEWNEAEFPQIKFFGAKDFMAPFASGSAKYESLVVIPCSMGTLGRIASGTSDDLISRAADVMLKERKKLVLVPREAPYNLIQLRNMVTITEAGGIILPASPSYYSQPKDIEALAMTVVNRVLDCIEVANNAFRWGELEI